MSIFFSNTLTKKKEEFTPMIPGTVTLYQCGPTVYWTQHIGNMRAVVVTDLLVRTFTYLGYNVAFTRNYTDVGHLTSDRDTGEDKMAKGAKREGTTPEAIAQKYIDIFEHDIAALNTLSPRAKPRATAYIDEMIDMVQTLLDKGYAYQTPLAIYFDVSKAKDYTRLSGQVLEHNIEEAGQGTVSDPEKRHPEDFSLWFFKTGAHEKALQTWTNPWSDREGFPGWHLECSAMIKGILGTTIDIHMGGIEHIPVHHTNEIAQSESANEVPLAHYWLHYEHLLVDGKKMSKSEGTSYSLNDIIEKRFDPLALRYFFLNSHYRSKQNFTWEALQGSETALKRLRLALGKETGTVHENYRARFIEHITNDLDMPGALALVWEVAKDSSLSDADKTTTLLDLDRVLGLGLTLHKEEAVPENIIALMHAREQARQAKNWAESDRLRDEIKTLSWEVLDTSEGQEVRKIS